PQQDTRASVFPCVHQPRALEPLPRPALRNAASHWPVVFSRLEQVKFSADLAQLSEKEIALLCAIAADDVDEFHPAKLVRKFHPQYFKRLGEKGLLIRSARGRYRLYHPLFRQFLQQQE